MVVTRSRARYLSSSALLVMCGVILSGPIAVGLVEIAAPQPSWNNAATFVQHYSLLQSLPYVFGFLIVGGFVAFMSCLVGTGREDQRPLEMTAVILTGVFASLVFFNYVLQTAFVPQSLDGNGDILAMVTMTNPRSLGWGLELYGYALLGIATAVAAPLFEPRGRQGTIRHLLIINCVVSVLSAVLLPIIPGWVLTLAGMVAGTIWNLLIIVIMTLVVREFKFGRNL